MAFSRRAAAFCLLFAALVLPGAAPGQSFGWTVNPGSPAAGDTMKVDVWSAPCTTVTVEFWVDGVFAYADDIPLNGTASWPVPAAYSGRRWKVRVVCPTDSDSSAGIFL